MIGRPNGRNHMTAKCYVCHAEDDLENPARISNVEEAYAHPRCIEQHNKDVKKNLRALDASFAADTVRDHDINVDDSYAVERFLRRQNSKVGKRFVAEVIDAAREQRDRDYMNALFETTEKNVEVWPTEASKDFIAEAAADLANILYRLACEHGDSGWRRDGAIETKAAHYATLLLIKHVAWRKFQAKLEADWEEWKASEESTSDGALKTAEDQTP
jgi:hypothetical protein